MISLNPGFREADVPQTVASVRVHGVTRVGKLDAVAQSEVPLVLVALTETD